MTGIMTPDNLPVQAERRAKAVDRLAGFDEKRVLELGCGDGCGGVVGGWARDVGGGLKRQDIEGETGDTRAAFYMLVSCCLVSPQLVSQSSGLRTPIDPLLRTWV